MKVVVVSLKEVSLKVALATAVYYLAILFLLALLALIIGKTIFSPPCSVIGQHECLVDGWSVAGLAATVLGVGGTILAVIGAVAVAAWWTGLDKKVNERVDDRVEEQVEARVNQMLKEQERKLTERTDILLEEQEKAHDEMLELTYKKMEITNDQVKQLQSEQKVLLLGVMKQEPWILETWAREVVAMDRQSEVGVRMVLQYLNIVDGFFRGDYDAYTKHIEHLEKIGAPSTDFRWYWNRALSWGIEIENQGNATYTSTAKQRIDRQKLLLEDWLKQQSQEIKIE